MSSDPSDPARSQPLSPAAADAVPETSAPSTSPAPQRESLFALLGGGRAAIETSVPPVVFVLAWLFSSQNVKIAGAAAVASALILASISLARRQKPRAVVLGLLLVVVSALIAARTGNAEDFFLLRLLSNAASALAWAASIVIGWPLLGVVLGAVLGTKATWRRDPVLLRAYSRASWVWVGQYLVRVIIFGWFWLSGNAVGLGIAQAVLTYPLIVACLAASGWVLFANLPKSHPGIRHPQVVA